MHKKMVLVDFENVPNLDLSAVKDGFKVLILVGRDQNKVPISLVKEAQKHGNKIEWIQISGKGKNALDFFIAYFLGQFVERKEGKEYIIISRDTGFDSLIDHLNEQNVQVRRMISMQELGDKGGQSSCRENIIVRVVESLKKVPSSKRPKKKKSLMGFLRGLMSNDADECFIEQIAEELFAKKLLYEEENQIKYSFK